jgi:hypothetical protein
VRPTIAEELWAEKKSEGKLIKENVLPRQQSFWNLIIYYSAQIYAINLNNANDKIVIITELEPTCSVMLLAQLLIQHIRGKYIGR